MKEKISVSGRMGLRLGLWDAGSPQDHSKDKEESRALRVPKENRGALRDPCS